ncbi:kelch protein 7 [Biomphalaria glabrata]|nr:kelch protein 7 [Biomphalaria glabrata]
MAVDPDFAKAIVQNVGHHWTKNEHCDVNIIIGEKVFACNRFHLCACSEFFNVLLHSDDRKLLPGVTIRGISEQIFVCVLNSIFKGENRINEANMIDLLYAAHHLQINFLIQKCETFISDHVSVNNYLKIYPHAFLFKSDLILSKVLGVMISNFEQFRKTKAFLNLPAVTILLLIERKDVEIYDNLIQAVIQWVGYEEVSTQSHFSETQNSVDVVKPVVQIGMQDKNSDNIEVNFRNENINTQLGNNLLSRKELVGPLIKKAHLNLISRGALEKLLENDIVMDNKEARKTVTKEISRQLQHYQQQIDVLKKNTSDSIENKTQIPTKVESNATKSCSLDSSLATTSSVTDNPMNRDHQQVIIFLNEKRLRAYNLLTNQFFSLTVELRNQESIEDINIYNNQFYILTAFGDNFHFWKISEKRRLLNSILMQKTTFKLPKVIFNEPFTYQLLPLEHVIYIMRKKNYYGDWTVVGEFNEPGGENIFMFNFKKYIISCFGFVEKQREFIRIFSFNTNTRLSKRLGIFRGQFQNIVTFIHADVLYVLEGNGNVYEIAEKNALLKVTELREFWDFTIKIYGAVFTNTTLYVFADLQECKEELPRSCWFGKLIFIHFLKKTRCCHFVTLEKDWLTTEI